MYVCMPIVYTGSFDFVKDKQQRMVLLSKTMDGSGNRGRMWVESLGGALE